MNAQPATDAPLVLATKRIVDEWNPAAVLVFGSRAKGRESPGSDYDIAILIAGPAPGWESVRRLQLDLEETLGAEVDLVILDDASPILAMQVLRDGRALVCRDPQALENFTVATLTDYADLKIVRAPIERRLMELRKS